MVYDRRPPTQVRSRSLARRASPITRPALWRRPSICEACSWHARVPAKLFGQFAPPSAIAPFINAALWIDPALANCKWVDYVITEADLETYNEMGDLRMEAGQLWPALAQARVIKAGEELIVDEYSHGSDGGGYWIRFKLEVDWAGKDGTQLYTRRTLTADIEAWLAKRRHSRTKQPPVRYGGVEGERPAKRPSDSSRRLTYWRNASAKRRP